MLKQGGLAGCDKPRLGWRATLLASAALTLVTAPSVLAQTTTESAPTQPATGVAEVVVTAHVDPTATAEAIASKRHSDIISDNISGTQIAALPVFGLGEALAPLPGVSFTINQGRGENQVMTVRGLNPNYNTVTVDGMQLPSTDEKDRTISFDVYPGFLINKSSVYKSWTVDQPSDAIGSVTNLETRSAFDNPGSYVAGHVDGAYWDRPQQVRGNTPSGAADLVASKTFGADDRFGILAMGSYYLRSSNTLNTTTSNFAYYPSSAVGSGQPVLGLDQTSPTATGETLKPTDNVGNLIAVPQTHQWYYYDDIRTRKGAFLRLDYDDHKMWRAALSAGYFEHDLNENRWYQYLASAGPQTLQTPTTGSSALGVAGLDFDNFLIERRSQYVDLRIGADFDAKTHLEINANYGEGSYRQDFVDSPFATATNANFASTYDLKAPGAPLLTPVGTAYMNPASYAQKNYQAETDQSHSKLPQFRVDFRHNADNGDKGFGFGAGGAYRNLSQVYDYTQRQLNVTSPAPTLAAMGTINKNLSLDDGRGQTLLLEDPAAVAAYVASHPGSYTANAGDALANIINDFTLQETIAAGYVSARYATDHFVVLAGLREEWTQEDIKNYLPSPFNSTTNFVETETKTPYWKLEPSLNVTYKPIDTLLIRAAVTRNLARPDFASLALNSSASLTTASTGGTASETIANPRLKPREATNFDASIEYYPTSGILISAAGFYKDITNELLKLTSTQQNATIPGYSLPVALTITQTANASKATVEGIELNFVDRSFTFLPGALSGLGARANVTLLDIKGPTLRMADGSFRQLTSLAQSSKFVANAALFYNYKGFHWEVSYNHTSKQPISFDTNNPANDQYWADLDSLDAQIGYQITKNLDVRAQFKNFNNGLPQKVLGPKQNLNLSLEENGRAYYAGIAFHF